MEAAPSPGTALPQHSPQSPGTAPPQDPPQCLDKGPLAQLPSAVMDQIDAKSLPLFLETLNSMKTWRVWDKTYHDFVYQGRRWFLKTSTMNDESFAAICCSPALPSPWTRLRNEAAAIQYIQGEAKHSVPIPEFCGMEEWTHKVRLQMAWIDGLASTYLELPEDRAEVARQLIFYADELAEDTSECLRSFVPQLVVPPYAQPHALDIVNLYNAPSPYSAPAYPLCHGDMTSHNVLVHRDRPTILAVIDWEYAGYWPSWCQPAVGAITGDWSGKGLLPVKPWSLPADWDPPRQQGEVPKTLPFAGFWPRSNPFSL